MIKLTFVLVDHVHAINVEGCVGVDRHTDIPNVSIDLPGFMSAIGNKINAGKLISMLT